MKYSIGAALRTMITDSMALISDGTCIQFRVRQPADAQYMRFVNRGAYV